ncbi:MAG: alpha/beta hydrolase [Cyanobacteria bacterium P01_D01_bin.105]
MIDRPNLLWLSVSPYLKCFDQRLLSQLTQSATVRRWEYYQTVDEPCCIQSMVQALHEYVSDRAALEKSFGHPAAQLHLAGHGVSGIVALLYAQQHPEHVASLTLLSVAAKPEINWQAHYYALRQLLPCSREMVLAQMTRILFGQQPARFTKALSKLLANDLDGNLTLHSLAHHIHIEPGQLDVPLLVCNGAVDAITGSRGLTNWQAWQATVSVAEKSSTTHNVSARNLPESQFRLWHCPEGNHFFHFYHATAVAEAMGAHWQTIGSAQRAVSKLSQSPNYSNCEQIA